jgi:hypothetical protein
MAGKNANVSARCAGRKTGHAAGAQSMSFLRMAAWFRRASSMTGKRRRAYATAQGKRREVRGRGTRVGRARRGGRRRSARAAEFECARDLAGACRHGVTAITCSSFRCRLVPQTRSTCLAQSSAPSVAAEDCGSVIYTLYSRDVSQWSLSDGPVSPCLSHSQSRAPCGTIFAQWSRPQSGGRRVFRHCGGAQQSRYGDLKARVRALSWSFARYPLRLQSAAVVVVASAPPALSVSEIFGSALGPSLPCG